MECFITSETARIRLMSSFFREFGQQTQIRDIREAETQTRKNPVRTESGSQDGEEIESRCRDVARIMRSQPERPEYEAASVFAFHSPREMFTSALNI